jgi:hypothetical protein
MSRISGLTVVVALVVCSAYSEHLFHRAFADQDVTCPSCVDHHRHAAALEIEGDLIDFPAVALARRRSV